MTCSALRAVFETKGQNVAAYGEGPVVLTDPNSCWFVAQGSVEVFATHLDADGNTIGLRTHVLTAQSGEIIFGGQIEDIKPPVALIGNGSVHTRILKLPVSTLLVQPDSLSELGPAIDLWISKLSEAVIESAERKTVFDGEVMPGQIAAHSSYCAGKGTVWVRSETQLTFCDATQLAPTPVWFPIAAMAWLTTDKVGTLETRDWSDIVADGQAQAGLSLFQTHALQGLSKKIELLEKRARDQQAGRKELDAAQLSKSLNDALVVTRHKKPGTYRLGAQDDLSKVVDFLADILNIEIPENAAAPKMSGSERSLSALLTQTNLSSREVQLTDGWWRGKSLPMIVQTAEGHPLAIWSPNRKGALAYDPRTDQTHVVDARLAASLMERAYAVYPTLMQDKIGFRDLLRTGLRGSGRDLIALLLFGVLGGLISLITPSLTATLISVAIPHAESGLVLEITGVLISVALVTALFQFLQATALLRIETLFESQAQGALWHRLMHMPSNFFRRFNSGNLTMRALGLSQMRTVLSRGIAMSALGAIFALLNLIVMIVYGGWLTLAALAMTLLTILVAIVTNMIKLGHLRQYIAAQEDLAGFSNQILTGIRKLRIAGAEDRVTARLLARHNTQRKHYYSSRSIENLFRAFTTIVPLLSTLVFFAVIEFLFDSPPDTGNFVAFAAAYGSFIVGISGLLNSVPLGLIALIQYERMKPILETAPEKQEGELPPGKLTGRIEMSRVSFAYGNGGAPVVDDVSLDIKPGQFVAIVGASGSGKSSLLRLLLGFEHPQNGSILYDGKDMSRLDVAALRRQFAVVLQDNQILGGTILENIAGSRPLTLDEAWEAAAKVGLDQTIRDMPMQMHTVVNDGATLSGGEKQRLMLARALAGTPRIMFMDEATSSLDNETQATVARSLSGIEMTRIVVAHRLSTVKDADVIYVMDAGRIVEAGTADDLIAKGGHFAKFVERQMFEY